MEDGTCTFELIDFRKVCQGCPMRFASEPLYVSHSTPAKAEGEALALGKAEALVQRREVRTHRASYRKLPQSPRHWAPNHPGGRRWEKKFDTSRAAPSHYADRLRTCADSSQRKSVPPERGIAKRSLSKSCTELPLGWDCVSLPSCSNA